MENSAVYLVLLKLCMHVLAVDIIPLDSGGDYRYCLDYRLHPWIGGTRKF